MENLQAQHVCNIIQLNLKQKQQQTDFNIQLPAFSGCEDKIVETSTIEKEGMREIPLDILNRMLEHLLLKNKYRDVLYLALGCNTGLRYSDLVRLHVNDLLNADGSYKANFSLIEKKTTNTRKVKRSRTLYLNNAVKAALYLYMTNSNKQFTDLLFTSESRNKGIDETGTLKAASEPCFANMIKGTLKALNESSEKTNCHSLRKTFSTNFVLTTDELIEKGIVNMSNDAMSLLQLQLNHSSLAMSRRYIGQVDEISSLIVNNMNIGYDVLMNYININNINVNK